MPWDLHVAAVASDTPTMEVSPFGAGLSDEERGGRYWSLHQNLLPLLGLPIGEMWGFWGSGTWGNSSRKAPMRTLPS